ncbi:MAG: DUF4292 domain-containing protein [Chitinophagaceae bacterium]|nr:DUF4292 domain-containing protein [Chitinophagaceae bacterium]MBK9569755.1 DUF4292 domain-containing protein [Chitinophagaceae bacterium]MBL0271794.1 DUF4292 domain-containing protein [Chitinophagaceae bacterium]
MVRTGFVFVITVILFGSCRSTKNIQTAIAKKDTLTTVITLPLNNAKEDSSAFIKDNYTRIMNSRIDFITFTAKVEVDYTDAEGKKYNVNAHIRMYKDSVIWISITGPLGIEGLRAYITPDSVRLMDKQKKEYSKRSVSYLQEITELPLDLASLQNLLLGNPVFLDSNIVSYSNSPNSLSFQSNGAFFKNLYTLSEPGRVVVSCKLDDLDILRNRTCYLTYDNYKYNGGVNFSEKRTINVTEKKKLDFELNFKQYGFNEKLSFPFNVPKNYKQN